MTMIVCGAPDEGDDTGIKKEPTRDWGWQTKEPSQHFLPPKKEIKVEGTVCSSCGEVIGDRYILQVAARSWHANCLRCSICHALLDSHTSCFIREENVFCKLDYNKMFGAKCFKCCRSITQLDWVRRAREQVYHLACFSCDCCKRQLSTGEEFGLHDNRVLCKTHYMEMLEGGFTDSDDGGDHDSHAKKKKTKRMRTTFTEEQIQILQANFQIDSNPDGQDLERIGQITGLSKRVTQVWFQNCRARQKKYITNGKQGPADIFSGVSSHDGYPTPQLDLHIMYSSFRAQPPLSSADSQDDGGEDHFLHHQESAT